MKPLTTSRVTMCIVSILAIAAGAGALRAQEDAQRCEGTVTDDQGALLADVTITFLDLEKNLQAQSVKTSKKGKFSHNFLRASTNPGWEIRAVKEGWKILQIKALTQRGDGSRATDETYMVGSDQKGLHKIALVPQSRSDPTTKGKCVVDFVMATDDAFTAAFRKLSDERAAAEGKTVEGTAPGGAAPGGEAPPATGGQKADPLEAGKQMIKDRDYAGAEVKLREAVTEKPDSAEAHLFLGESLLQNEKLAEAEPELKKALELDPQQSRLGFNLGLLYEKKGRPMQAIPYFEKELELSPDSLAVLQHLANLYDQAGNSEKSIQTYEKMIAQEPDRIEYYGNLADAYKKAGNAAKEAETYQRMGEADPTGMAFYNLGNILFNNSDMAKAETAYRKAIQQAPGNAKAHYQLGLTLVNLAKFKEAATELETFAKLAPKDSKAIEAKSLAADLRKMQGGT